MVNYLFFVSKVKRYLLLNATKKELIGVPSSGEFFDGIGVFDGKLHRSPSVPGTDAWNGRGNYMIARHKPDGSVDIATDPLGQYPLYIYNKADVFCVSNNIYLLAEVLERNGIRLKRTIDIFGYFVTHGSGAMEGTGYEDIQLLEVGSRIAVTSDLRVHLRRAEATSLLYSDRPYPELLEEAAHEILDNVRALSNGNFRLRICDLTGGMDSRTVLAAVLKIGERDRFLFHTKGGRDSTDANVAGFLRKTFGLASAKGKVATMSLGSPYEEVCRTVARVGGLFSMNYVVGRYDEENSNDLSLGGGMGELMRHFWSSGSASGKFQTPLHSLVSTMQGRSGVLNSDVARRHQSDIAQFGIDAVNAGVKAEHAGHLLYLKARTKYHFGVWWAASARAKFHPLYSPAAIKAAFSLSDEDRVCNRVGFDLMKLMAPQLIDIPFADKSWSSRLHANPPPPVTEGALLAVDAEPPRDVKASGGKRQATVTEIMADFHARDRHLDTLASTFDVKEAKATLQKVTEGRATGRTEATACRIVGAYAWINELDVQFQAQT